MNNSGGFLDNQTWQIAWKTAPLAKVQLCEYENQTLEAFVADRRSYVKYDCAVARQNLSLLATAHDCETGLYIDAFLFKNYDTTPVWNKYENLQNQLKWQRTQIRRGVR